MTGVDFRLLYVLQAIHPQQQNSSSSMESGSGDGTNSHYFVIVLQIKEHLASLSTFGDLTCWLRQVCLKIFFILLFLSFMQTKKRFLSFSNHLKDHTYFLSHFLVDLFAEDGA